jgi:AcrR family transcriptional regulator
MSEAVTKPDKAEAHRLAQRRRILAAAQERFIESGFHSASMAEIAESAGVSAGLIYRYFENKNAIILEIINAQLAIATQRIREMRNTDDLAGGIVAYFEAYDDVNEGTMSAALFLEIGAEATRDAEIAKALNHFDSRIRDEFVDWFKRSMDQGGYGLDARTAKQRALSLTILLDGIKVRKAREPGLDRDLLRRSVEEMMKSIEPGQTGST